MLVSRMPSRRRGAFLSRDLVREFDFLKSRVCSAVQRFQRFEDCCPLQLPIVGGHVPGDAQKVVEVTASLFDRGRPQTSGQLTVPQC